jgi:predicted RNA-binding protein Jag
LNESKTKEPSVEKDKKPKRVFRQRGKPPTQIDERVREVIADAVQHFQGAAQPFSVMGLSPFQRKQIHQHFERTQEYKVRTLRDEDNEVFLKVYPVGELSRMAETKVQEVLMSGESISLPPMDSFERFIIHEYMKNRGGVRTESDGEGEERHVVIFPVFGRTPKKAKRRLTR